MNNIKKISFYFFFLMLIMNCSQQKKIPEQLNDIAIDAVGDTRNLIYKSNVADTFSVYSDYVLKYGGEIREDYGLVGSKDLLMHLNELPESVKELVKYVSIDLIEEIPPVLGLNFVEEMQFHGTGLKYTDNLENIPIKTLIITANPLLNLEAIGKNSYIEKLDLTSSTVSMLPNMNKMISLRELNLSRTTITTLDNIETIPNEIDLYIFECDNLENIDALKFADIRRLFISKTGINAIGGKGSESGLYNRKIEWFDKYLPQLAENNPNFQLCFSFKNSDL